MLITLVRLKSGSFAFDCTITVPSRSFCGTHFIIFTFSGRLSGTGPVYRHITYIQSRGQL